jgi:hypothetical protein
MPGYLGDGRNKSDLEVLGGIGCRGYDGLARSRRLEVFRGIGCRRRSSCGQRWPAPRNRRTRPEALGISRPAETFRGIDYHRCGSAAGGSCGPVDRKSTVDRGAAGVRLFRGIGEGSTETVVFLARLAGSVESPVTGNATGVPGAGVKGFRGIGERSTARLPGWHGSPVPRDRLSPATPPPPCVRTLSAASATSLIVATMTTRGYLA